MKRYGAIRADGHPKSGQTRWLFSDLKEAQDQARVMSITEATEILVVEVVGSYKCESVWREENPAPQSA